MLRTDQQLQGNHVHLLCLLGTVFVQARKLGEEGLCLHWGLVFSALRCLAMLVHQPFVLSLNVLSQSCWQRLCLAQAGL